MGMSYSLLLRFCAIFLSIANYPHSGIALLLLLTLQDSKSLGLIGWDNLLFLAKAKDNLSALTLERILYYSSAELSYLTSSDSDWLYSSSNF